MNLFRASSTSLVELQPVVLQFAQHEQAGDPIMSKTAQHLGFQTISRGPFRAQGYYSLSKGLHSLPILSPSCSAYNSASITM